MIGSFLIAVWAGLAIPTPVLTPIKKYRSQAIVISLKKTCLLTWKEKSFPSLKEKSKSAKYKRLLKAFPQAQFSRMLTVL